MHKIYMYSENCLERFRLASLCRLRSFNKGLTDSADSTVTTSIKFDLGPVIQCIISLMTLLRHCICRLYDQIPFYFLFEK